MSESSRPSNANHPLTRRRFLRGTAQLAGTAALAGGVAPFFAGRAHAAFQPDPRATFETTSGRVRGGIADGIRIFRGIPYGASTAGKARFLPPAAPTKWAGILETLEYGDTCPQTSYNLERPSGISWFTPFWPAGQSEDCLRLNLWTPGLHSERRPVLVWLHGGGYSRGSGGSSSYEGTNIAIRNDVVVVTVNHRLNVFGYCDLREHLGDRYESSGNAGMLDIVLALEWVRDNAERFGGDPENVMIFGESGGGAKVSTLMGMPAAKGLFHRAIIQSGPGLRVEEPDKASITSKHLLNELGLSAGELGKLQQVPHQKLLMAGEAAAAKAARSGGGRGFRPVLGSAVPQHPFDPVASPLSASVPLMIGTNRHEATLFVPPQSDLWNLDDESLIHQVQRMEPDHAEEVLATYRAAFPEANAGDLYFTLASDRGTRMRSIQLAERKAAQHKSGGAPVYMYLFDWLTPAWKGRFRAAHAFEIPFVFGNTQLNDDITGGGPDAVALAAKMRNAWAAFARSGDPNHAELREWPSYDVSRRSTMVFNDVCESIDDPGKKERVLWQRIQGST